MFLESLHFFVLFVPEFFERKQMIDCNSWLLVVAAPEEKAGPTEAWAPRHRGSRKASLRRWLKTTVVVSTETAGTPRRIR